jgi:chemotaxis protein MotB
MIPKERLATRGSSDRETPARSWLMSFNDLLTLILTFFVLMISMSSISAHPLREASQSLMKALGLVLSKEPLVIRSFDPFVKPFRDEEIDRQERKQKTDDQMDRSQLAAGLDGRRELVRNLNGLTGVQAKVVREGVAISLKEDMIYETGSVQIKREARPLLQIISHRLTDLDARIAVEGHTDDSPVENPQFESNWEFSTARAVNMVSYLVSEGRIPPENTSAVGYADLKPLVPNDSPGNRARNRRMDIILINQQK